MSLLTSDNPSKPTFTLPNSLLIHFLRGSLHYYVQTAVSRTSPMPLSESICAQKCGDAVKVDRDGARMWFSYLGYKRHTSVTPKPLTGATSSIWKTCQLLVHLFSHTSHPPPGPTTPPYHKTHLNPSPEDKFLIFHRICHHEIKKCVFGLNSFLYSQFSLFSTKVTFHNKQSGHITKMLFCSLFMLLLERQTIRAESFVSFFYWLL